MGRRVAGQAEQYAITADLLAHPKLTLESGARVLIVRGAGGRELMQQTFESAGAIVQTLDVYERAHAAYRLLQWRDVRLFTPWAMNVSTLGVAALRAQDEAWQPARPDEILTGSELALRYFRPLAKCDLLSDSIQEKITVVGIAREGLVRSDFARA